jgi:hypothetical protein
MRGIEVWAVLLMAAPLAAQSDGAGRAGPRETLPRQIEVDLARSAAPRAVSDEATVLVWSDGTFEVAHEGSNGATCYVARSWPESLEPHCFDEEGSRTILPMHVRRLELQHEGRSEEEIDAEIAEGLRTGDFRLPSRPVMSYMMSAAQNLISDEGQRAGAWRPHLMIYYPYLTQEALALGPAPSTAAAIVVDAGTPLSNIMVVVQAFAEVAEGSTAAR